MSSSSWQLARHLALLDDAVIRLIRGQLSSNILLVLMPPRHGKSEYCCGWVPPWYLNKWPRKRVILCSYEATFAATWGRKGRDRFIRLGQYGFPAGLSLRKQAESEWETEVGGGMRTAGVGGGITGRGCDLLITDDLIKNSEQAASETYRDKTWDWWRSTAFTRLEPGGACVVIGTPWHRDDVLARIKNELDPYIVQLPAIAKEGDAMGREPGEALWPQRFDVAALDDIKAKIGAYYWSALYGTNPRQHEQAEWPEEYFDDSIWCESLPPAFEHAVIAIDPARGGKQGDYCPDVFVGWAQNKYWVWSTVERRPVEQTAQSAVDKALRYDVDEVYVEGNGSQYLVRNVVMEKAVESGIPQLLVLSEDSVGNKENRIRRLGPRLCDKQFKFLDCPGNRLLVEQLKDFPIAEHDDGPDALEMAVRSLNRVAREKLEAEHA